MTAHFLSRFIERIKPETPQYNPARDRFVAYLEEHRSASAEETERLRSQEPDSYLDRLLFPDYPPQGRKRARNDE